MSYLGDAWDFDKFALKDMWGKIKDDPERLLVGAVDPWSTKMWNSILGKDYEPLVDQMGGPYGGSTFSAYGNTDGGVYQRARDEGIDTTEGEGMHDIAHTIAAIFGTQGLASAAGMGGGAGAGSGAAGGSSGMDWMRYGQALARTGSSPGNSAPSYGAPPGTQQPAKFRDTFKEGEDERRRKRIAQMLLARAT